MTEQLQLRIRKDGEAFALCDQQGVVIARTYTPWDAKALAIRYNSQPDLLEALQVCLAEIVTLQARVTPNIRRNLVGASDKAQAAIAKALPNSGQSGAGKGGE